MLRWPISTWILSMVAISFWLIIGAAIFVTTRREKLANIMSTVWAITCPEQNCAAIVDLVQIGCKMFVRDCSVQAYPSCDRRCVAVLKHATLSRSFSVAQPHASESVGSEKKSWRF